ncbi:FirrV-1-A24 [Feldmannia irregularis virus a]|uniref:FirrV-1-A24 n=1 Tax=Feldmannia irregularis virus a TaxID=231992 RepID=Q6XM63_9PHYC|nr:FirrV-1-A24 [Feldmannia irregularis virus a]AAR26848.1 FirrV-1-A24 [Feldmannia irregularis virus a]
MSFVPCVVAKQTCLKLILEYCGDLERILLSRSCWFMHTEVAPFIPCRQVFRSLTRPTSLPGFFHHSNSGVWSVTRPTCVKEDGFFLSMVHHVGENSEFPGVSILSWLSVTVSVVPGSLLANKTILSHLMVSNDAHKRLLSERIRENKDECIILDAGPLWEEVEGALRDNTSLKNFCFKATVTPTSYTRPFTFLGQRQAVTPLRFIDICGPMSNVDLELFGAIAEELMGVAFRGFDTFTMVEACSILSESALGLKSFEIDRVSINEDIEQVIIHVVDDLSVDRLVFSSCRIDYGVFVKLMAITTSCPLDMLGLNNIQLTEPEVSLVFFLPCINTSSLTELVLTRVRIPDSVSMASSIYTCLTSSKHLVHLNLYRSRLGKKCLHAVIEGLTFSLLERLNLAYSEIGDLVYELYDKVGEQGRMKLLQLDCCTLPRGSGMVRKGVIALYKSRQKTIMITTISSTFI